MEVSVSGTLEQRSVSAKLGLDLHGGVYWRYCDSRFPLDSVAAQASRDGRYHRKGGAGCWYGAACATGAWAELMRWAGPAISARSWHPGKWHFGSVRFRSLYVVDLTDPDTLSELGLDWEDLRKDYKKASVTQDISDILWDIDEVDGILAPGSPLQGHRILVLRRTILSTRKCGGVQFRTATPPEYMDLLSSEIEQSLTR